MGEGAMHGLGEYVARPIKFCANDVGRARNRSIECDAKRGVPRICHHEIGVRVKRRPTRAKSGR